jgi:iron complex outermembrane receptor protein
MTAARRTVPAALAPPRSWQRATLAAAALLLATGAGAEDPPAVTLDPVVVTATRSLERSFDLPVSVDRIDAAAIHTAQPMVNLSETLVRVPGVFAMNRGNYAQDLQISVRGFGARAAFGVRGVRLYQDGIPATMPDGQGQTGSFSLFSTDSIEVLRGPFSTLYGNASGGVISVFSEKGRDPPTLTGSLGVGSFGTWVAGAKASGVAHDVAYVAALSRFNTDGYREHSAAVRDLVNAKLDFDTDRETRWTVVGSNQVQIDSQDPLGLTRAQWEADPRQVDPVALQYDTRKNIRQTQGGVSVRHRVSDELGVELAGYGGTRTVRQYLAFSGAAPTSSGGVVDLDRDYSGLNARIVWSTWTPGGPLKLTVGGDAEQQRENRSGYVNNNGQLGALRRDEDDRVVNTDAYAQLEWMPDPAVSLTLGLRFSKVSFRVDDHYVTTVNPDDSGGRTYRNTSPVLGAVWHVAEWANLYANYGEGFETPTFAELAYRPVGPGVNLDLNAGTSRAMEAGAKFMVADRHRVNLALFAVNTDDEIVVNSATGGRTSYRNAGTTLRRGVEALWDGNWGAGVTTHLALTWLRAEFADPFASGTPPTLVPAGAKVPGVPPFMAYGNVIWTPGGWGGLQAGLEAQYTGKIYVNDRNSDAAAAYAIANLWVGFEQRVGGVALREFVRANNVTDVRYVGSVIVGDTNGRYFESAPGLNWFGGLSASVEF